MKKIKIFLRFLFLFLLPYLIGCTHVPDRNHSAVKTGESPSLLSLAKPQAGGPTNSPECTGPSGDGIRSNFVWHGSGGEPLSSEGSMLNVSMRQQERKAHIDHAPKKQTMTVIASWYYLPGRKTASGERFNPNALTAATHHFPFGTLLRVTYGKNSVIVRVNDHPGKGMLGLGRGVDLTPRAARELGLLRAGTGKVVIEPVSV